MSKRIDTNDKRRALVMAYRIATEKRNFNRYGGTVITRKDEAEVFTYSDMLDTIKGMLDELAGVTQKPLTLEELHTLIDSGEEVVTYCEGRQDDRTYANIWFNDSVVAGDCEPIKKDSVVFEHYGTHWRAWAHKPTDAERAAAPWEEARDGDL